MDNELPINSYVCYLVNSENGKKCLFDGKKNFCVPVYQRLYSWDEKNIDDFLKSIIDGYYSGNPVFFGTMQFNIVDEKYEIVDGQQRITTIILFANVLDGLLNEHGKGNNNFNLTINNSKLAMKSFQNIIDDPNNTGASIYHENRDFLKNKFNNYIIDNKRSSDKDRNEFISNIKKYLLTNLYFVVLETKNMPLVDTVKIFNTINTTGMDLDASDIFKLQYYDYLRKKNNDLNEEWMKKINDCYEKINKINKINKMNESGSLSEKVNFSWILDIYKHCFVGKYEMSSEELLKSNERFFGDLFKKVGSNATYKYDELLDFNNFKRLVDLFSEFWLKLENNEINSNIWHALAVKLIDSTRYGRYWTLPFVHVFFNSNDESNNKSNNKCYIEALKESFAAARYFIVNSINYAKAINPVHTKVCEILKYYASKDINNGRPKYDEIIKSNPYEPNPENNEAYIQFLDKLEKDTFDSSKCRVICLLLAIQSEIKNKASLKDIKEKLFNRSNIPYDIEHIYPQNSFKDKSDDDKKFFNGIGNLVILERSINRGLQDSSLRKKTEGYGNSRFQIVENLEKILNDDNINLDYENVENVKNLLKEKWLEPSLTFLAKLLFNKELRIMNNNS